jgi:hypothetical protein
MWRYLNTALIFMLYGEAKPPPMTKRSSIESLLMLISPVGLHGGYGRQLPRVAECRPDANFIDLVNTALGFTRHSPTG